MPQQDDSAQLDKNTDGVSETAASTDEKQMVAEDTSTGERGLGSEEQVMNDNEPAAPPKPAGEFKRFSEGYWHHKRWTLPLTLLVIIGILFAIPTTRYPLLALKMKRQFDVVVWDSKTHTPVSGAKVTLDGATVTANASGAAVFHAKVGKRTLEVSKQYYKSFSESVFVGAVHTDTNARTIPLVATGRQVPIKIVNRISGKPVAGADIKVLDTEAKTDANGMATIVLPTTLPARSATITAGGYNQAIGEVQVTDKVVPANTFSITPSGRVYFLSNLSGDIDVVSTNLDGTARKTVLAGTGSEDTNNTVLLASTDWKYLALLSKRGGGKDAELYLINTANDQLTTIDSSAAALTPVGWDGHYFIYQAVMDNVKNWQPGQGLLESFNADTGKTVTLDRTTAQGTSPSDYVGQSFGYDETYIVGKDILYVKLWNSGYLAAPASLKNKQNQIMSVAPDGSGKQALESLTIATDGSYQGINAFVYEPGIVYYQATNNSGATYYIYQNGSVTQSNTVTADTYQQYQQNYATYLLSPSGNQTFWAEPRDGKNTLFLGNASGADGKQIASLSDYTSYGWYTDNYLLVEKGGSELYIMPASGGNALKISDYYKPAHNYNGYGSGYGGL